MNSLSLSLAPLTLQQLRSVYLNETTLHLADELWPGVEASAATVERIVNSGDAVYGINTGFGLLAQTRIPDTDLAQLQTNLVLSHSAGVGDALAPEIARLIIVLKIKSLAQGYSGVRRLVIERLQGLLDLKMIPQIPSKGSVGASGDLAPLAHLAACLLGEGQVWLDGISMSAADALKRLDLEPLALGPKEGLALLNGTQVSTALGLAGLFSAEHLFAAAVVTGALSVDALKGSVAPFDERIQTLRGQPGQIAVAAQYRRLLEGSDILASHIDCEKVQDPYSLRCQPQVMGACLDVLSGAAATLEIEANAVTDNPLIFSASGDALSGGNFHAEPVAFASDHLALAIAEIASLSERRIALLIDPSMNGGMPAFLVENSGLNSGFMIAQVTAAALVSENKALAHPASVDSIPTSANQEDHVSMATHAGRRLADMCENALNVVAIELLGACQALEFHRPSTTSAALQPVLSEVRERVAPYANDRYFAPDIDAVRELLEGDSFYARLQAILPSQL